MNTIRVTESVPFVTRVVEVGQSMRNFGEISGLIESLDLTDIVQGKAKLFVHGEDGEYTIYPIGCRIAGYKARQQTPRPIPARDTATEFDKGVRIKRQDVFVSTQVTLYFKAPQERK